jgi:hypothetical protein
MMIVSINREECRPGFLRIAIMDEVGDVLIKRWIDLNPTKLPWRWLPLSWLIRYRIWRTHVEARIIYDARGRID